MVALLNQNEIDGIVSEGTNSDSAEVNNEVKKLNPDGTLEVKKGDKVSSGSVNNTVKQGKLNQDVFDFLTNEKGLSEDVISSKMDDILNNGNYKNLDRMPESIKQKTMSSIFNKIFGDQQIDNTNSATTQQVIQQPDNTSRNNIPETQTANKRTTFAEINLENGKKLEIIENNDNGMLIFKKINSNNSNVESTKKIHKDLYKNAIEKYNNEVLTKANDEKIRDLIKSDNTVEDKNISVEKYKEKLNSDLETKVQEAKLEKIKELRDNEIEKVSNLETKIEKIEKKYSIENIRSEELKDFRETNNDLKTAFNNKKMNNTQKQQIEARLKTIKNKEITALKHAPEIKEIETKEYTPEELKKAGIDETKIREEIREKIIENNDKYKLVSEVKPLEPETAKTDVKFTEWILDDKQSYINKREAVKDVFVKDDNLGHIITKDSKNQLYINNSLEPLEDSKNLFRGDGTIDGEALMRNEDFVKAFTADKKKAIQNLPALQSFLKENYSYTDDVISEEMQGINEKLKGTKLDELFTEAKKNETVKDANGIPVKKNGKIETKEVTYDTSKLTFNNIETKKEGDFYNSYVWATDEDGNKVNFALNKNKTGLVDPYSPYEYKASGILRSSVSRDKFRYNNHFDLYESFFNKNKIKLDGSEAEGVIVDTIKDIFGKSSGVKKDDLKIKSLDQIEKFRNAAIKYDEMLNPKKKGILGFASGITSSIIGRADSVEVDISEFGFEGNDNAPKVITINNEMAANLRETATKIQNASDDVIKHNYDKRKMKNNNDSFFTRKGDLDKANYEVFDDATKDIKEGIVKKTSFSEDGVRHRVFQQDGNFYSIATEVGKDIKQSESGKEVAELSHKLMSVTEKNGRFTIGGEIDAKTIEEGSILKSVINKLGSIDEGNISKNSISLERLNLAKSNSTISKLTEAGLGNDGMKGLKSMAGLGIAAGILFTIKSVADASKEQRRTKQMEIMALRDKYQGNPVY